MKILDCHVHYALPVTRQQMTALLERTGTDLANIVVVPHRQRLSSVPDALALKASQPGRFYEFCSLDVSEYFRHPGSCGRRFVRYVGRLRRAGCDGVKIIEGKPDIRRQLPVPDFDSAAWEPFWTYAEETELPILWHVNDPEEFWDERRVPSFAKERGWFYGPDTVQSEEQYRQVEQVLRRHPRLRIIFAHMYFMSAGLKRLWDFLCRYPSVCVDLTPGIELYRNLSAADPEEVLHFFSRFQDRILYGTDIGARCVLSDESGGIDEDESLQRVSLCRRFLDSGGDYTVKSDGNFLIGNGDVTVRGLALPETIRQKILHDNFTAFVGGSPRPVSPRLVLKECRHIRRLLGIMSMFDRNLSADFSALDDVTSYFKNR